MKAALLIPGKIYEFQGRLKTHLLEYYGKENRNRWYFKQVDRTGLAKDDLGLWALTVHDLKKIKEAS